MENKNGDIFCSTASDLALGKVKAYTNTEKDECRMRLVRKNKGVYLREADSVLAQPVAMLKRRELYYLTNSLATMVTCPDDIDTTNMPALAEDTRPDPAVDEMLFHRHQLHRTMTLVNFNITHNTNNVMEEVD